MIEFKVTGETWKEILEKLEGMWTPITQPESAPLDKETVVETVEEPTDKFKVEIKIPLTASEHVEEAFRKRGYQVPSDPALPAAPIEPPAYSLPGVITPEPDSAGNPWNPDIHTRTKAKNDDGSWRLKRKSPGFEKKKVPTGPVVPIPGKVITPDFTIPSILVDSLEKLAAYAIKIGKEKNLKENVVREYLTSIGIPNVLQVPKEKLPEVAEKLKTHFGVDY